jgi:aspartyl-tRNA synthetase
VVARANETVNPNLPTGEIEVRAEDVTVLLSAAAELPLPVAASRNIRRNPPRYRFLDLRRETLHANIVKRTKIIGHAPPDGSARASPNIRRRS